MSSTTERVATLAQVPVLLMWIYSSWLVLLFGAELAFAYQNEKTFAMERLAEGASYAYREALGFWTMIELGKRFDAGQPSLSAEEAAKLWNVPLRLLNDTLSLLEDAHLVVRSATNPPTYQPGRSLDRITVEEVGACFRESGRDPSALRQSPVLIAVLAKLMRQPDGAKVLTVRDIVSETRVEA
jgi:membrane protein